MILKSKKEIKDYLILLELRLSCLNFSKKNIQLKIKNKKIELNRNLQRYHNSLLEHKEVKKFDIKEVVNSKPNKIYTNRPFTILGLSIKKDVEESKKKEDQKREHQRKLYIKKAKKRECQIKWYQKKKKDKNWVKIKNKKNKLYAREKRKDIDWLIKERRRIRVYRQIKSETKLHKH